MLNISRLNFFYDDMQALFDVSLAVKHNEIVSVVGSNGAGKSTLLKNISQQVRTAPKRSLLYNKEDLTDHAAHQIVESGIVHVPEGRKIFPDMSVLENLQIGAYTKRGKLHYAENIEKMFAMFPVLKERAKQMGGTLSGGEQQMLAIARGLMANPKLLLLDEPSLGLAPKFVHKVFEIIQEINRQGVAVLLVEQNVYQSLQISHRAYVLEMGRIVLTGTGKELLSNDRVKTAFLGM